MLSLRYMTAVGSNGVAKVRLDTFLKEHSVGDNDIHTHTAFGAPWGKYNIADEEMGKFFELYCGALGLYELHIIERPKPIGPLIIDIDFKFDMSHKERLYKLDDIKYTVATINGILNEYFRWDGDMLNSFIFEKEKPSFNNKEYKDGFHIMYPFIALTEKMRYLVLYKAKNNLEAKGGFNHLPFTNSLNDVFDSSIVSV